MDAAMARRMLAVLLLCSLAFEAAFAKGHRSLYEDSSSYHYTTRGRGGGRLHRPRGKKAKAHKAKPAYVVVAPPVDSHVPPPYPHVPASVPSTPPTSPPPAPYYDEVPSAPPPSYENPAPVEEPSASPPYQAPSIAVLVQGLVLCQNCLYVGTSYYSYGKPLQGAIVKLTCESSDGSIVEGKAQTDNNGFFLIQVPNFDFEKYHVVDDCKVYLVSSSTSTCKTPTDINYGISGSPVRLQKTFEYKTLYSSGPLVFAPLYCKPTPPPFIPSSPPQNW